MTFEIDGWKIDYEPYKTLHREYEAHVDLLWDSLPNIWWQTYQRMTNHPTDVCWFGLRNCQYAMDHYSSLVRKGLAPADPSIDDRVVAVWGISECLPKRRRNIARQRYLLGPIEMYFKKEKDKGHFVAHSLGGDLDVNLFVQKREINRGWSQRGKIYRSMESHCFENPGTFFFSRPIYSDSSVYPAMLEFGLLERTGELWVEVFEN
jgi:hypothetical protein